MGWKLSCELGEEVIFSGEYSQVMGFEGQELVLATDLLRFGGIKCRIFDLVLYPVHGGIF